MTEEENPKVDPLLGITVANLFVINALIGAGASAHVYRATRLGLPQTVAIKILQREFLKDNDVRARFHREARVATRISHPAVVPVLMTGELPIGLVTHGEAFIVYEFVDGRTLRALLESSGPLGIDQVLGIVIAAADAVGAAHHLGIIHRDLKPENLMLIQNKVGSSQLRVLDFGLAKHYESAELALTHTGAILGTPSYLSPEGARGQAATSRSDVYSLAIIAYECLVGQPPFRETSPIRLLMQHADSEPPPLRRPAGTIDVPLPISRVIIENLAKSPEARAQNAEVFAQMLRSAAKSSNVTIENYGPDSVLWQDAQGSEDIAKMNEPTPLTKKVIPSRIS